MKDEIYEDEVDVKCNADDVLNSEAEHLHLLRG